MYTYIYIYIYIVYIHIYIYIYIYSYDYFAGTFRRWRPDELDTDLGGGTKCFFSYIYIYTLLFLFFFSCTFLHFL